MEAADRPATRRGSARAIPRSGVALGISLGGDGGGSNERIAGRDDGLLLHIDGAPIRRNAWGRLWRATVSGRLPGVRYHDLRHAYASTLLSDGVGIAAVAGWLGHASPSVTLSTYAHMMPVDEDRARGVIATALRAHVSILCPDGTDGLRILPAQRP